GVGNLERINPGDTHSVLMHMQHDPGGFGLILVEDVLEDFDHELHRRVVIVEQDTLVERGLFGLGLFLGAPLDDGIAVALVVAARAIATARHDFQRRHQFHLLPVFRSTEPLTLAEYQSRGIRFQPDFDGNAPAAKLPQQGVGNHGETKTHVSSTPCGKDGFLPQSSPPDQGEIRERAQAARSFAAACQDNVKKMASTNHPAGELAITIVERLGAITREDWNALLAPDDSPFLDWDWLHAMEESKSAVRKTGLAAYHMVV